MARVDPIEEYLIPKPSGGSRRMAILSRRDGEAWHRLGGRVADIVEPRLSRRVLANRADIRGAVWEPAPVGPALRRARGLASAAARRSPLLVRTDVKSFYPSVTPGVVFRSLRETDAAADAATMLEGWGSEGYAGLPIGPPASAVLANVVLSNVDDALRSVPFLRWVDDYLVAVHDERQAAETIERLDEALNTLCLQRAPGKTHLVEGRSLLTWPGAASGV